MPEEKNKDSNNKNQSTKGNVENLEIKNLENSEVEITGEISKEKFKNAYHKAFQKTKENLEVPGFRKGKAPDNVVIEQVGEQKILEEAAGECLAEEYPKILLENKIDAIGQPQINITKIAKDSNLGFKAKTAILPKFSLPDYKKIAKAEMAEEEKVEEVTEKEVEDVISQVRRNRAGAESGGEIKEEDLPEITDEFVKTLGEFQNVDDFKNKIRENLAQEKQNQAREKKRGAIVESLIKETDISLPEIVVEGELQKMLAQLRYDIEKAGMKYDEYLSQMKKTEEDIRKEWREGAEKRAKFQMILNKIASEEKIMPDEKQVEEQVKMILETNKEASPERAQIYVETYLTNEKVFQFLESQK